MLRLFRLWTAPARFCCGTALLVMVMLLTQVFRLKGSRSISHCLCVCDPAGLHSGTAIQE